MLAAEIGDDAVQAHVAIHNRLWAIRARPYCSPSLRAAFAVGGTFTGERGREGEYPAAEYTYLNGCGYQDQGRGKETRGPSEHVGLFRRRVRALQRRQAWAHDACPPLRHRRLRGHPGLLERKEGPALFARGSRALRPDEAVSQRHADEAAVLDRGARQLHPRALAPQRVQVGRLRAAAALHIERRDRRPAAQPGPVLLHLRRAFWQIRRGRRRHSVHGEQLAPRSRSGAASACQDHRFLRAGRACQIRSGRERVR